MKIEVKRAKINEWKSILRLLKGAPELQCSKDKVDSEYTKNYVKESIIEKKEDVVLVAEENKKVIGVLTAEIFKKKGYAYWTDFVVEKRYRNKGIGGMIYKKFEDICRENKISTIAGITKINDKEMHEFIKKRGFNLGKKVYFFEKKLK